MATRSSVPEIMEAEREMDWVFWALAAAGAARAAEECSGRFPGLNRLAGGSNRPARSRPAPALCLAINAASVALMVVVAMLWPRHPLLCLSVPAWLTVSAILHLIPAAATRRWAPGSLSALLLQLPLSIYAFHVADGAGLDGTVNVLAAFALGSLWMLASFASSLLLWVVEERFSGPS